MRDDRLSPHYESGTNTKLLVILILVAAVIAVVIGFVFVGNLVSPSTDPHNFQIVIPTSEPTPTPSPVTPTPTSSSPVSHGQTTSTPTPQPTQPSVVTSSDALKIHFVDVGQADCILLEHDNKYAFIDVGKSTKGNYLSNIRLHTPAKVEWILATHQDSDHIGNMTYAMSLAKVANFIDNGRTSNTMTYKELMDKISTSKIEYTVIQEGDSINTWSDVKITDVATYSANGSDVNDDGVVLRLEYEGVVVGFMADVSEKVDNDIGRKLGDVDILKVAHHGAETASSEKFLKYAKPEVSVISVGDNSYGHPADETIQRLSSYGKVYRTDEFGCVEIVISNGGYSVVGCEYV